MVKFDFLYKHAMRSHWSIKEGAGAMVPHNAADVDIFRGSLLHGVEDASNRAESRMSVTGRQSSLSIVQPLLSLEKPGSRRGSIAASSHPEDVDLGWLAWKESRKNESRR